MSLDDFSLNEEDRAFFKQAADLIYEWLPQHKRMKLHLELISEGYSGIDELLDSGKFFRLLNFLEVNYVRVEDWTKETLRCLQKSNNNLENNKIKDIEIELTEQKRVRISEIYQELQRNALKENFYLLLKSLGLEEKYKSFLERQTGGTEDER